LVRKKTIDKTRSRPAAVDEKPARTSKKKRRTSQKLRSRRPPSGAKREPKREDVMGEMLIIPVRNMILFPGMILPVMVGRERSIRAIQEAVRDSRPVGLLLQKEELVENPAPGDLYRVGTLAEIVRYLQGPDGRHHTICQGTQRFRVLAFTQTEPLLVARVEPIETKEPESRAIEARFVALKQQALEILQIVPGIQEDLAQTLEAVESPSLLADMVATFVEVPAAEKQDVLETFDVRKRLDKVIEMLGEWSEVVKLSHQIRQRTKGALDKAQREYYLREQLRAIQKELGEGDEKDAEIAELSGKIAALTLPEDVEQDVRKELRRLERTPEQAAEYSMLRTYLDVFTELPWNTATKDSLDLVRAARILDEDHYGLEQVKQRILEFLAVRKLNPTGQGPTLCLVGPPGVGKTSLGRSIARAMGRKFARISLGGVHDEAEIRGHRRTYVGAMPGAILAGLRNAGVNNPVFMLDELDKLGAGLHGDPSAALLEVLDPAQNNTFRDNYLGVPFDLSSVLFIGTANVLQAVPGPLRDRLEVIELPGYTEEEKVQIARRYLVKRQVAACGLKASQCRIGVTGLREIIRFYTREAGVRNLEREIGAICRRAAMRVARRRSAKPLVVGPKEVRKILGAHRFERDVAMRTGLPGVATGLAWTPVGGVILFIEASRMPGRGRLTLTGQLGDVMQESARAAITLLKTNADRYGIDPKEFEQSDIHVHIPAGAVPKDGPSAGVAMFTALVSLFTGRCVKSDLAMTGEISLRGLVLPVGGIKEKVLAALAAGVKTVMLPARNKADLEDIPVASRKQLRFVWLTNVDDAITGALQKTS